MTDAMAEKLQRESATLAKVFGWLFAVGAFLLFSETIYVPLKAVILASGTEQRSDAVQQLLLVALGALRSVALLLAVWQARRVFKIFAQGNILVTESGRALTRLGDWLVVSTVLALTIGPEVDAHNFGAYLSATILIGVIGLAIRLVGRAIEMAATIKSDLDQFV